MKNVCQSPRVCWTGKLRCRKDGVWSSDVIFSEREAFEYYLKIANGSEMLAYHLCDKNSRLMPCGKCINCLAAKRKDMTCRIQNEMLMTDSCCFITLTYNDNNLPFTDLGKWSEGERTIIDRGGWIGEPTLLPADVQKFIKRLRRHLEYRPIKLKDRRDHVDKPLRYFAVGEYGTKTRRPHYHILIFGWKPSDMEFFERKGTYIIYRSPQIEKLWKYGYSTVGDVTSGVAKYCARYVTKKFANLRQKVWEDDCICPEFTLQSVRKGGIGAPWLDNFYRDICKGFVTALNEYGVAVKYRVPKYYYDRLRKIDKELWLDLRDERIDFCLSHRYDVVRDNCDEIVRSSMCRLKEFEDSVSRESL